MRIDLLTKADRLYYLKNRLKHSIIDNLYVFTVADWNVEEDKILHKIESIFFGYEFLIIRSSTASENHFHNSLAGYYHSELEVPTCKRKRIKQAINNVIGSYSKNNRVLLPEDQVIIQNHIDDIKISGVVLTREQRTNGPYYVINYDLTNRTDTVTRGLIGRSIKVVRWQDPTKLSTPWDKLILAVKEVEQITLSETLDIEFGIDKKNSIHIFQVRPLKTTDLTTKYFDNQIENNIKILIAEYSRLTSNVHNLPGSRTILSDMADWNPAEILGGRPNILDTSLYRYLVTQSTWNKARVSIGYSDVAPAELMVVLGNKPYIDTRVSFNSLTPKNLCPDFTNQLVDYYIDKLSERPELQDKVEFKIVLTCFDFSFDNRISEFKGSGFSISDISYFKQQLLSFTNNLLYKSSKAIRNDLKTIELLKGIQVDQTSVLDDPRNSLEQAFQLLNNCRNLGVYPFSRLARFAFIGLALLKNLRRMEVVDSSFYDGFLNSIKTVATQLTNHFHELARGSISLDMFMEKYGHLRPGTYNILVPRYDQKPIFFSHLLSPSQEISIEIQTRIEPITINRLDEALSANGINYPAKGFLEFIRQAVEYRELSKFRFSKILSDAIEMISIAGEQMGFSRNELAFLDIDTILEVRNSSKSDLEYSKGLWGESIKKNQELNKVYRRISLPPVIRNQNELEVVPYYESYPNFVTHKKVTGKIFAEFPIDKIGILELTDCIVLLENADPGYDWIFTLKPKGLITKYGGVGSHMAIRCAEFGLPAAIGCGELIFDRLSTTSNVLLDCGTETIVPL